jgi:hypothetical protein
MFITLSSAAQGAGDDANTEANPDCLFHAPRGSYSGGYPARRSSSYTGGFNRIVERSAEAAPAPAAAPTYKKVAPAPAAAPTYRRAAPYFNRY